MAPKKCTKYDKFEFLALAHWDVLQVDEKGKPSEGRFWFRHPSNPDDIMPGYNSLTSFERSILWGLYELRARQLRHTNNDPAYVSRALQLTPRDRSHIPHTLHTLTSRMFLLPTNQQLDFAEQRRTENNREYTDIISDQTRNQSISDSELNIKSLNLSSDLEPTPTPTPTPTSPSANSPRQVEKELALMDLVNNPTLNCKLGKRPDDFIPKFLAKHPAASAKQIKEVIHFAFKVSKKHWRINLTSWQGFINAFPTCLKQWETYKLQIDEKFRDRILEKIDNSPKPLPASSFYNPNSRVSSNPYSDDSNEEVDNTDHQDDYSTADEEIDENDFPAPVERDEEQDAADEREMRDRW